MTRKVILISVFFFLYISLFGCGSVYTDTSSYQVYIDKIPKSNTFMPDLATLPQYQSINVYYYERLGQSINLIVTYSSESYQSARDTLLSSYVFLKEPLTELDFYLIPEVEFQYQSFTIKVVNDDDFEYPEQFGMLGYSDSNFQLSFMFFYDDSLNELGNGYSMQEFLEKEFIFPQD
ncbi:MAG: hypothetical protein K9L64_03945 [Candidatus Izimaplasma sp.]|nr:hypothetical protein [Candidatus Izimaplasma bacterium]